MDSTLPTPSTLQASEIERLADLLSELVQCTSGQHYLDRFGYDGDELDDLGDTVGAYVHLPSDRAMVWFGASGMGRVRSLVCPDACVEFAFTYVAPDEPCDLRTERLEIAHLWAVTR